jgi:hypothetical protein
MSCSKDDGKQDGVITENGVIVELPVLWSKDRHESEPGLTDGIVRHNIIFEGNPVLNITEDPLNRSIRMVDIETGEDIWKWNDTYLPDVESTVFSDYFQQDNLITLAV